MNKINKIALITGGSKGIGLEIAYQLGLEGYYVIIAARNENENCIKRLNEKNIKNEFVKLDITSDESIKNLKKYIKNKYKKLDVLINNAGIAKSSKINATTRDEYLDIYSTNVASVAIIMEEFYELLNNGNIVNVSSSRGSCTRTMDPNSTPPIVIPYSVSKSALNLLTIIYSQKFKNIKVNAVSPGYCVTNLNNFKGTKSAADGAKVAVKIAMMGNDSPTGGFFEMEGDDKEPKQVPF